MLDKVALAVIILLIIGLAAAIVALGSLPGKIARGRNHPCPDAVNAASWIGLATGVLWPFAFVWAFLPVPAKPSGASADEPNGDQSLADLQKRLSALEVAMKETKEGGRMITVISLAYIAIVVLAFKVIKIKVSPTSVAAAVVGGVFMLGGIVIVWKQAAPMTGQMVLVRHVLQVIPDAREFVSKVNVKSNQLVKKGDSLFEILPDRYQDSVDESAAQLAAAKQTVSQLDAAVDAAVAAVKKSAADTATSKAELDTALELQKNEAGAIAKLKVTEAQQAFTAAQANDKVVQAQLKQSQFSLSAAKYSVDVADAGLKIANFDLERCNFTSPVDGQVMNMQVREGTPVARWRFVSVGTVMDLGDTIMLAIFPQNLLNHVKAGDDVEIAVKSLRGQIVTGKVDAVIEYTGEGQLLPSGNLPIAASIGSKGDLGVRIRLDDQELAKKLPMGAAGVTAIYTDFGKPFHIITKITIRIKGWMYYMLPV